MTLAPSKSKGFSLVEITIAIGIMAFCMLAIFGLLPVGLTSNTNSIQQTKAAGVISSVAADLRAKNPKSSTKSARYGFSYNSMANPEIIYTQEDGSPTGALGAKPVRDPLNQSAFRVTVGCAPPTTSRGATMARIIVTWPAFADEGTTGWPKNQTGAIETVIGLNRN